MKRVLFTIAALVMGVVAWAQNDDMTREQADKLDSVTIKLMNQERYEDAIKAKERELAILKSLYGEKDTTYIKGLAFSAKLYYRNKQAKEAASAVEKALQLYADNISTSDELYAFYLDNLSLYQISTEEYDKAKENCRKALTIYEQLGKKNYDMAIILMRMAEICHYSNENQEAIKYELRSLNVISTVCGKHSDEYINELPFLQKYYQAVGDEKKASEIESTIERLKKETADGIVDLPEPMQFKSAAICHDHNYDAMKCIKYYLTHKLAAKQMNQAAQYILNWTQASDEVSIPIDEDIAQLATSEKTLPYLIAYFAAYSYYCLDHKVKTLDEKLFYYSIDILLQFYKPNSELTGKVKMLENYLSLQKNGKLEKEISKVFEKLIKTSK
jgi:tetratricopeptide (TPR) repeat protein